jgi:uncharacterized protein YbjT (DUF2867 family)
MPGKIENRKALVFGASGLVGNYLLKELMDHASYSAIEVFSRKPIDYNQLKVTVHVVDFNRLEDYAGLIKGDDLFICLGTTIRKAGSIARVEEIDRDLPVRIASIAAAKGVSGVAVVSSIGANSSSRNYYTRIKGEMEAGIRELPFEQIVIARPSILFGDRKEFRFGELVGKAFMKAIGFLLVGSARRYRGIHGRTVAVAMIRLIRSSKTDIIYESDVLQKLGAKQY